MFLQCDGIDIAEGSLAIARQRAAEAGITNIRYATQDVNTLSLSPQEYDIVWSHGSLHHIQNLEHVCSEIRRGLVDDGLFILHEYVGPSRFQFPDRQKELIQSCFAFLPESYRQVVRSKLVDELSRNPARMGWKWTMQRIQDKLKEGDLFSTLLRRARTMLALHGQTSLTVNQKTFPSASSVMAADPSEAIRSAEIMSVVKQHFDITDYKPLGGTILQFLLDGIAGNFDSDNQQDMKWLNLLFRIEDALMEIGEIGSDFAYIVASPKRYVIQ